MSARRHRTALGCTALWTCDDAVWLLSQGISVFNEAA